MKVRVNQLDEEVDEINSENQLLKFRNEKLQKENDLLVNKCGRSQNANKISVEIGCQTEEVSVVYILVIYNCIFIIMQMMIQ